MPPADPPDDVPGIVAASAYLATTVADGLLPAAVLEVGSSSGVRARVNHGAPADAIFDLASLTKVLGTGIATLRLVVTRHLDLDQRVAALVPAWRDHDRADVRVRDLLTHAAGLPAHLPLYARESGSEAIVTACASAPLSVPPRTAAIYSDIGFIVLGAAIEAAGGAPLDLQVSRALAPLSTAPPGYGPPDDASRIQTTGYSEWRKRMLRGDVHDDNAAAMGRAAGHAGMFGTAAGVGDVARTVLRGLRGEASPLGPAWLWRAFARRSPVPGSSRALAWDTALPTSSCGRFLSASAIGHTGFTGTSLWIDPVNDLYIVLLTNRVAGRATTDDIARIRRVVHETIGAAWRSARHG